MPDQCAGCRSCAPRVGGHYTRPERTREISQTCLPARPGGLPSRGLKQLLDGCHLCGRRPVPWADDALDDPSLAVDQEGLRVSPDLVPIADLVLRIDQDGKREPQLANEWLHHLLAVLVLAHGQEHEPAILQ